MDEITIIDLLRLELKTRGKIKIIPSVDLSDNTVTISEKFYNELIELKNFIEKIKRNEKSF